MRNAIALVFFLLAQAAHADLFTPTLPPGQRYLTTSSTSGVFQASRLIAVDFASAPVVFTSSQNINGSFMEWFASDGQRIMVIDGSGGVRGLRINPGTYSTSGTADLDLFGYNGSGPILQFRRNDTSVTAQDDLMVITVRDHDTSTGGETEKSSYKVIAGPVDWNSNTPMEQWHTWGLTRRPSSQADYMVLSSTGLLVVGYPGVPSETQSSCSTCTLQVISPAGYGIAFNGGRVSAPQQPGNHAFRSGSAQAVPNTTATELIFNGSVYAVGGSSWTSRSTTTVEGIYFVACGVQWAGSATGVRQLSVQNNVTGAMATVQEAGRAAGNVQAVSQIMSLAIGDSVSCLASQTSGGPLDAQQSNATMGNFQKIW